jgi:hypothetical protein
VVVASLAPLHISPPPVVEVVALAALVALVALVLAALVLAALVLDATLLVMVPPPPVVTVVPLVTAAGPVVALAPPCPPVVGPEVVSSAASSPPNSTSLAPLIMLHAPNSPAAVMTTGAHWSARMTHDLPPIVAEINQDRCHEQSVVAREPPLGHGSRTCAASAPDTGA